MCQISALVEAALGGNVGNFFSSARIIDAVDALHFIKVRL
jgi:hypothetical protein